jgi:hypothetical protein
MRKKILTLVTIVTAVLLAPALAYVMGDNGGKYNHIQLYSI